MHWWSSKQGHYDEIETEAFCDPFKCLRQSGFANIITATTATDKYTRNVLQSLNYIPDKSSRLLAPERQEKDQNSVIKLLKSFGKNKSFL